MTKSFALTVALFFGVAVVHAASDWPQWQGPDRTRISKETGLLKEWPSGGPRMLWTANNLGTGYGSMSVAGDRVFLQGSRGNSSFVIALNRADGSGTTRTSPDRSSSHSPPGATTTSSMWSSPLRP